MTYNAYLKKNRVTNIVKCFVSLFRYHRLHVVNVEIIKQTLIRNGSNNILNCSYETYALIINLLNEINYKYHSVVYL